MKGMIYLSKVIDIYNYIDSFAPFSSAMEGDNVGLLIGNKDKDVKKVLIALDATLDVVNQAKEIKVDLIITHHPIIYNPLKNILSNNVVYMVASSDISVISAHTNYDLSKTLGVNTYLAEILGLKNYYFVHDDQPIVVGEYEKALEPEEFLSKVKSNLNAQIRYTKNLKPIKTVAVGGGTCGGLMDIVLESKADAFVTGEIKHHEFIYAYDNNLFAVDATHYATEKPAMKLLSNNLSEKFPDVQFIISGRDKLYD